MIDLSGFNCGARRSSHSAVQESFRRVSGEFQEIKLPAKVSLLWQQGL
jgi:hypothetical protein